MRREYISTSKGRRLKHEDELSRSDTNKLLKFSENPEKYARGTQKAREKVEYLESVRSKMTEGQLATYAKARKKYDVAFVVKKEAKAQPKREYRAVLKEGFDNHKSVKIRYKGSWRTIDPYALNDTYVVSYCHFARDIRTFRIDRIQGAELLKAFSFDASLQTTTRSRLIEAPSYHGYRRHY